MSWEVGQLEGAIRVASRFVTQLDGLACQLALIDRANRHSVFKQGLSLQSSPLSLGFQPRGVGCDAMRMNLAVTRSAGGMGRPGDQQVPRRDTFNFTHGISAASSR